MSVWDFLVGRIWPQPSDPRPLVNGGREALFRAVAQQHEAAMADLSAELDPDAQRLIRRLNDDRRFLEHGR